MLLLLLIIHFFHTNCRIFEIKCEVEQIGNILLLVDSSFAPIGVDRFINLVQSNQFEGARVFRVVPDFVAQFGLAANPNLNKWEAIPDESMDLKKVTNSIN